MKRTLLSSLIAAITAGCIAIYGDMPDGYRITGAVGMYYMLWWMAYDGLEWIEKRWRRWRK